MIKQFTRFKIPGKIMEDCCYHFKLHSNIDFKQIYKAKKKEKKVKKEREDDNEEIQEKYDNLDDLIK